MFKKKQSAVRIARRSANDNNTSSSDIYIRTDIGCGIVQCPQCNSHSFPNYHPILNISDPIMIPDGDILLNNTTLIEDPRVRNIILLNSVLLQVQNKNKSVYGRLKLMIDDSTKGCYVFPNDRYEMTYSVKKSEESVCEYNARMVRIAAVWFSRHVSSGLADNNINNNNLINKNNNNNSSKEVQSVISDIYQGNKAKVYLVTHDRTLQRQCLIYNMAKEDTEQLKTVSSYSSSNSTSTTSNLNSTGSSSSITNNNNDNEIPSDNNNNNNNNNISLLCNGFFSCLPLREYLEVVVGPDSDLLDKTASYHNPTEEDGEETNNNNNNNKYTEYIELHQIEQGVQEGRLLKGKLRVSQSSCFFGEIRGSWEGKDYKKVMICGRKNMNRAFSNDIVAVEILPTDEWNGPNINSQRLPKGTTEDAAIRDYKYNPCGKIVGIFEKKKRTFCGSVDISDALAVSGAAGEVSVLFQPKANDIPKIRLRTRQLDDIKNKRLVVVIDDWSISSTYPSGHYVEVLGNIGDKDTEAKVILFEHDIPHYDFSQGVYDCLPKGQWKVEKEEVEKRLDLRDLYICSVDPLGCRDIDDALHYRVLKNGNYEVGVHIADVTHFLKEGDLMDCEAAKRSTSVYLVDRRINMLPQLLTENLCSIVANEDRFAFSIIWEFDKDNISNVVNTFYGKSVIRSRAALYYGDAQKMIDDNNDNSELALSLKGLMKLSKIFKSQREKDGALFLASQEFKFKVENDHVNSLDMSSYVSFEANSMIEEWMLYANASAASKIYQTFPQWALLRRHQQPAENAFDTLNEALDAKIGVKLDGSTSLSLNQTLGLCVDPNDTFFNKLVRILTTRCLKQAQYFISSNVSYDEFKHYGLAMPIYTHFTSPIRRYADVIVHRQLAAAIGVFSVSDSHTRTELMNSIADNINYRHEQAQKAGRDSQNLFTGFYLRQFANSSIPHEDGYIIKITETHVFVMVPKYGQEAKVSRDTLVNNGDNLCLLNKVRVNIIIKVDGDVMRTKMEFQIFGVSCGCVDQSDNNNNNNNNINNNNDDDNGRKEEERIQAVINNNNNNNKRERDNNSDCSSISIIPVNVSVGNNDNSDKKARIE